MFFFRNEVGHALLDEIPDRLVGALEPLALGRGGAGGHRRRQVDQPARIDGEPAHHLERREAVLFGDLDRPPEARLDPHLGGVIVEIEKPVVVLLRGPPAGLVERLRGLGILRAGGH